MRFHIDLSHLTNYFLQWPCLTWNHTDCYCVHQTGVSPSSLVPCYWPHSVQNRTADIQDTHYPSTELHSWPTPAALLATKTQVRQSQVTTHTRLTALCSGLPGWAGTRKIKPIWILLKQETVSGSGISWAICKSASRSRQITKPAPLRSVLQAGCPSCHPTNSVKALKAQSQPAWNSVDKNRFRSTQFHLQCSTHLEQSTSRHHW